MWPNEIIEVLNRPISLLLDGPIRSKGTTSPLSGRR